ncbi:oligopeptide:H+ symporter [Streptomyces caniscabiei]|uniref:MFS transporter n=1 Tax=Streptomyces caniscabiei TaxID=2746961 RepID=A0A927L7M7_9ACTN|nr:oligopeptide:H+ symporter [Streptomyces caniscabiei]MBD9727117.1 MFS transporter [Streptomyces caniscabiei]MDX3512147.1 oligopeptide:H+ symporter [Streptomyces caniscabiei]MDX3721398.1 oligopeptide:H+ symporter [Streptomyces caniscabiei]WEO26512.1 oligopeptide:H+ symporter [Streptomyces caniscabiei]
MASSLTKGSAGRATPGAEGTFFGHPRGLATLFMTEMWERFSYYGMKALLTVYLLSGGPDASKGSMGGGLAMDLATTTTIVAVYSAMVYLLAMPGGWLGDRVWGPRRTVAIAAVTIMCGHLVLALPGGQAPFFAGLVLVAAGSGLLKANISTMVGHLYDGPEDPRRDGGFTIFYMGINAGAFFAPLAIGTVGQEVNWHLGFGLAAVGMAIGLAVFLAGSRTLSPTSDIVPKPLAAEERAAWLRKGLLWLAVAAVFYGAVGLSGHFTLNWAMIPLTVIGLVVPAGVLLRIKRDKELTTAEQSKMTGYIWFFVAAAVFWMIYDQGASTVQAFGSNDEKVAGSLLGFAFPTSWYQSLNPLFIMALAPVFAWLWLWLNRQGREPSTAVKFAMALVLIGVSFFFFLIPLGMAADGTLAGPMWLVGIYFIQTVGELCLSPVGLSVTTKMAPAKYASQMMGVWFLAVTAGDSITGLLSNPAVGGFDLSGTAMVAVEATLAVLAGFAIYMYRKKVRALTGDVN